jgi:hypothetical protein
MERKTRPILLLVMMLTFLTSNLIQASSSWQKFVTPDKSFSFHNPQGWKVEVKPSNIKITGSAADEQPSIAAFPSAGPIERNAHAFLFVLEFALGAPFTGGQEEIVLAELRKGWKTKSEQELRKYDAYPKIVEAITRATDRKALEDLRQELEKTIREWLAESERSDPAVAVIFAQLKEKGKVLIPGNPPLTVMAAAAYSEIYAYSELLQKVPSALPDRVSPAVVAEIKSQLLKAWNGFTAGERGQVASTPGLWVSMRSVLQYGNPADQDEIRAELGKIAAPVEQARKPGSTTPPRERPGSGKINPVGEAIKHTALLNIKQIVFRNYMYSRGFSSVY